MIPLNVCINLTQHYLLFCIGKYNFIETKLTHENSHDVEGMNGVNICETQHKRPLIKRTNEECLQLN